MIWNTFLLLIGLATLTLGAEGLVRGSSSLAIRIGLTPLIIGLTIVAFGTSAPELVVSLTASLGNQSDIAIGNVVGSNIFNIGIILGITALLCPIRISFQVIKLDGPIMVAASILLVFLIMHGPLSRPVGFLLFGCLIAYIGFTIRMAKKEASSDMGQSLQDGIPSLSKSPLLDLAFIIVGLLLLVAGSRFLVVSAVAIARHFGLSEAIIGLTIIAAGTSMPELATSIVAAIRHQPDIAVGNVVGSNIFNIFGILGAASMASPLAPKGITHLDLWVMVAFSIALMPLMYTGLKLQRWEGGFLLLGYGVYLWMLWP
ncbi:MAG: calcium/sodium antiporter [Proteobacteria bacterium]|nr:calcium/sodium antiporter [Pseudomonadota bacterium]